MDVTAAGRVMIGVALLAATGAVPSARADVLQVDDAGATWVSGGPAGTQPALAIAPPPSSGASDRRALTAPASQAGPAAWRARVAQLAAKYDISPALLEAVVWQESRWRPAAVSVAGARGLAQLMPGTALAMGVDPDDPRMNLEGGARYLRRQLDAFGGDIERALAAYNAGPARVAHAGGVPTIRETQAYVAAIMARLSQPVRR